MIAVDKKTLSIKVIDTIEQTMVDLNGEILYEPGKDYYFDNKMSRIYTSDVINELFIFGTNKILRYGKRYKLYDSEWNQINEYSWDSVRLYLVFDTHLLIHNISEKAVDLVSLNFDQILHVEGATDFKIGKNTSCFGIQRTDEDGNDWYELYSFEGQRLSMQDRYDYVNVSHEKLTLCEKSGLSGGYCVYNSTSRIDLMEELSRVDLVDSDCLLKARIEDKFGVIDQFGNVIVPFEYMNVVIFDQLVMAVNLQDEYPVKFFDVRGEVIERVNKVSMKADFKKIKYSNADSGYLFVNPNYSIVVFDDYFNYIGSIPWQNGNEDDRILNNPGCGHISVPAFLLPDLDRLLDLNSNLFIRKKYNDGLGFGSSNIVSTSLKSILPVDYKLVFRVSDDLFACGNDTGNMILVRIR